MLRGAGALRLALLRPLAPHLHPPPSCNNNGSGAWRPGVAHVLPGLTRALMSLTFDGVRLEAPPELAVATVEEVKGILPFSYDICSYRHRSFESRQMTVRFKVGGCWQRRREAGRAGVVVVATVVVHVWDSEGAELRVGWHGHGGVGVHTARVTSSAGAGAAN